MRCVMVMFDSLCRRFLQPYGCDWTHTPNFKRLAAHSVQFDASYVGSLPCMPARRELHTGRINFLHRSWGPIEPFDDSMPLILRKNGIHAHLCSDHTHYWEDGGATYHTKYTTWEGFRGQEGDPWKGVVGGLPLPEHKPFSSQGRFDCFKQDVVDRSIYADDESKHPQVKTFDAGLEFLRTNAKADNWFLQIETFDPHEPFFSYERYKQLYPHTYNGPQFDWPDYAPVTETEEEIAHVRYAYAALVSMCDASLGRVLDVFDREDLWKDTMLIVNTDHGFLLSEHGYWAKNYMPQYNEIANTPLFIWDPRLRLAGERRGQLVQTIDLPATILRFFGLPLPEDMQGKDLFEVMRSGEPVREGALFGTHGAHVCVTDGRYVLMKAPAAKENTPLFEYTLMPQHMNHAFSVDELRTAELAPPFSFTKGCPVLRVDCGSKPFAFPDLLYDLENDPQQLHPIEDEAVRRRMTELLLRLMRENGAPAEQYQRLGLPAPQA
jgi:arylsulfatase A-like enzyme